LFCFSTSVSCRRIFRYRLNPETFGYTVVRCVFPVPVSGVEQEGTDT